MILISRSLATVTVSIHPSPQGLVHDIATSHTDTLILRATPSSCSCGTPSDMTELGNSKLASEKSIHHPVRQPTVDTSGQKSTFYHIDSLAFVM